MSMTRIQFHLLALDAGNVAYVNAKRAAELFHPLCKINGSCHKRLPHRISNRNQFNATKSFDLFSRVFRAKQSFLFVKRQIKLHR